jgi:hypothetical protein
MTVNLRQFTQPNRRNIERAVRYLAELNVTGTVTYGQMFIPRLVNDMAMASMLPYAAYSALALLYVADSAAYCAFYPKLYTHVKAYGLSRASDCFCRGLRDVSMFLVNSGGMALFYFALLNTPSVPIQITTIVGMTILKGFIEFSYDFFDLHRHPNLSDTTQSILQDYTFYRGT